MFVTVAVAVAAAVISQLKEGSSLIVVVGRLGFQWRMTVVGIGGER